MNGAEAPKPKKRRRRKLPTSLGGGADSTKIDNSIAATVAPQSGNPKKRKRRKMPKSLSDSSEAVCTSTSENSGLDAIQCDLPIKYFSTSKEVEELMEKLLAEVRFTEFTAFCILDVAHVIFFVLEMQPKCWGFDIEWRVTYECMPKIIRKFSTCLHDSMCKRLRSCLHPFSLQIRSESRAEEVSRQFGNEICRQSESSPPQRSL